MKREAEGTPETVGGTLGGLVGSIEILVARLESEGKVDDGSRVTVQRARGLAAALERTPSLASLWSELRRAEADLRSLLGDEDEPWVQLVRELKSMGPTYDTERWS